MRLARFTPGFASILALVMGVACAAPHGNTATTVAPAPLASASALPPMSAVEIARATPSLGTPCTVPGVKGALYDGSDPSFGNPDAPVVIVEFGDFQCPFCKRSSQTIRDLANDLGPDKLRVVFKHHPLPFHPRAKEASEVGQAIFELGGSKAFAQYYGTVYDNQGAMERDDLLRYATAAGVDASTVLAGLESGRWSGKVQDAMATANDLHSSGTPDFYINGVQLSGAQPMEKFRDAIRDAQAAVDGAQKDGTPLAQAACKTTAEALAHRAPPAPTTHEEDTAVWKVEVGRSPVRGQADALVTIVEFADFQCPFCGRVEATLEEVQKKYGSDVRIVWKDEPLPFHPRALPSARLARAAFAAQGSAGFWRLHDALFTQQAKLTDADLKALGAANGLSGGAINAAVTGKAHQAEIDADVELADDVQAAGTPHFFINGRRLVGAQPIEGFSKIIDDELAKARALVAGGTPAARVYETTIKDGKTAGEIEKKTIAAPSASAPFRGARGARATMQLCSDFQCPFCGRVEPTLKQLLDEFPGKLRIVWRDMPLAFHKDAPLAAEAAREALAQHGNAGFWAMHDKLFANQAKEDGLKAPALSQLASEIGLDVAKFDAALVDHRHKAAVDADKAACEAAGISGTPASITNGFFLSGAQPRIKFEKIVKRALKP